MERDGYKPYSHEATIAYAHEHGPLTRAQAQRADTYRKIRNDITYRAETVEKKRVREAIALATTIVDRADQ